MREIKFRAWDKTNKKMWLPHKTFYKYLVCGGNQVNLSEFIQDNGFILMQYTGIEDEEGKEIYEGDNIRLPSVLNSKKFGIREVSFHNGSFYAGSALSLIDNSYIKIIDNKYQSKKLSDMKECKTCGTTKKSNPTPDGDEICPNCGDMEMMDKE